MMRLREYLARKKSMRRAVLKPCNVKFGVFCEKEKLPEYGSVRLSMELDKFHRIPTRVSECMVHERYYIGGSAEFSDRFYADCRSLFARVYEPSREPLFWLSDLSHEEERDLVKNAPMIRVNGLERNDDTVDWMYSTMDSPKDDVVFANQKAALSGELEGVKLFAVECGLYGQIRCYFYNEMTQQLSLYILKYESLMPMTLRVARGLEKYLIVYEDDSNKAEAYHYVLRYVDAYGGKVNERTFMDYVTNPKPR